MARKAAKTKKRVKAKSKKSGKAKARKSKAKARKAKVQKKPGVRISRSARPKAKKKIASDRAGRKEIPLPDKAPSPTETLTAGEREAVPGGAPNRAASISLTMKSLSEIVSECANGYLNDHSPKWNVRGDGNDKTFGDIHVDLPLFLDSVWRCLDASGYTFDENKVYEKAKGGTVGKAKEEINRAAKRK